MKFCSRNAAIYGRRFKDQTIFLSGGIRMQAGAVRKCGFTIIAALTFTSCGGGGSAPGASSTEPSPTPSPSPTPTVVGTPGPITATWKGDGTYAAQSDPSWPFTLIPVPGDSISSVTDGPPITFASLGQTITITFAQSNFYGLIPTFTIYNGKCSGLTGTNLGNHQYRMALAATGANCSFVQFQGDAPGYYPGDAISFAIDTP